MRKLILLTTPSGLTVELEARYHPHLPKKSGFEVDPNRALLEVVYPVLALSLEGSGYQVKLFDAN